jgi:hypothetical protein
LADLVDGRYPESNPTWAIFGQQTNVAQSDIPGRSNIEWLGLSGAIATTTLVATGVGAAVAVPVDQGMLVSKVTLFVTATAASTPTHQFAALYAGTGAAPALITASASADATTAAIAASAPYVFTLPAGGVLITPTNAPAGFIYVSVSVTASTVPTVVTVSGPTIAAWGTMVPPTGAPLFFSATHGSALAGTAAATIASPSNVTQVPLVLLT